VEWCSILELKSSALPLGDTRVLRQAFSFAADESMSKRLEPCFAY
jgi:hypothetical protein